MIDLQQLGFTKEDLQQRVVDQICQQVMTGTGWDEDGEEFERASSFARTMNEAVRKQITESINALAEKHVLPNVANYIETLCLQETNQWGEKKGEPVTFIQYLVNRAEAYLTEKVDSSGKGKAESDCSWRGGSETRVTFLVHQHLKYSIETAMKGALKNANEVIVGGIQETVKMKLKEVSEALKVTTNLKS